MQLPEHYLELLTHDGVDSLAALQATSLEELIALGLKPGHARALKAYEPAVDMSGEESSTASITADTTSLETFLGPALEQLQEELDGLGVEEVSDFLELDEEDIVTLQSKLKKVPAKKLAKKIAALQ